MHANEKFRSIRPHMAEYMEKHPGDLPEVMCLPRKYRGSNLDDFYKELLEKDTTWQEEYPWLVGLHRGM